MQVSLFDRFDNIMQVARSFEAVKEQAVAVDDEGGRQHGYAAEAGKRVLAIAKDRVGYA